MIRRDMRPRLPASLLFAALVACFTVVSCGEVGIAGTRPTPPSGIKGTVILGPTCPVSGAPESNNPVPSACLTPYAAQMVVLDDENKAVAHIASVNDGALTVDLVPGADVIAPAARHSYPIAETLSVTVAPG